MTHHQTDRIDTSKIVVPEWKPLTEMHPCDMQVTMKKGCALTGGYQNTTAHKVGVISAYYAMIAEYDDMVGEMVAGVEAAGLTDDTIFVLSSDHGDMQMQHQQFYKMVAYEASSHVPLVIAAGKSVARFPFRGDVNALTSHVDIFPTLVDIAGAVPSPTLDGTSLVPFLESGTSAGQPDTIISQFHGENMAMSWYMIREKDTKAVFWGTGKEHGAQLFNLTSDPDENTNLAKDQPKLVNHLEKLMLPQLPYPDVTMDVAQYNIDMVKWWITTETKWACIVNGTCTDDLKGAAKSCLNASDENYWGEIWQQGPAGYWKAWHEFVNAGPVIQPCLANLEHNWPPQ